MAAAPSPGDPPPGAMVSGSAVSGSAVSGSAVSGSAVSGSAVSGSAVSGSGVPGSDPPGDLVREVAELRLAVAALAEAARWVDARAAELEQRLSIAVANGEWPPRAAASVASASPTAWSGAGAVASSGVSVGQPAPVGVDHPAAAALEGAGEDAGARGAGHPAHRRSDSTVLPRPRRLSGFRGGRAGRHRSSDPEVRRSERSADRRYAVVSLIVLLPWVLTIGLFAVALGLVAISTFQ